MYVYVSLARSSSAMPYKQQYCTCTLLHVHNVVHGFSRSFCYVLLTGMRVGMRNEAVADQMDVQLSGELGLTT